VIHIHLPSFPTRRSSDLIINSRRLHDGIAIQYSQPSMQVHWLLDNLQHAREWMLHSGGDRGSHFTGVRNGWTKLIEDLGLQYERSEEHTSELQSRENLVC